MFWEFHIMHPSPTHLSISISAPHHCSVPSLKEPPSPPKKINLRQSKQIQSALHCPLLDVAPGKLALPIMEESTLHSAQMWKSWLHPSPYLRGSSRDPNNLATTQTHILFCGDEKCGILLSECNICKTICR